MGINKAQNQLENKFANTIATLKRQIEELKTSAVLGNSMLSGHGFFVIGASASGTDTVTFSRAFSELPDVIVTFGGDTTGSTTYGSGGNNVKGPVSIKAVDITLTTFDVYIHSSDATPWLSGDVVFYQWFARGKLA